MGINLSKVCKARANEVDGIANTVKRYNEDMNVDTTYSEQQNRSNN